MAIESNFQKFGVTFENAYTKVKNLEYTNMMDARWEMSEDPSVAATRVEFKVLKVKFTAITYAAGSEDVLEMKGYDFVSETAGDLLGECYAHLKGLPEFAGAVDA